MKVGKKVYAILFIISMALIGYGAENAHFTLFLASGGSGLMSLAGLLGLLE